MWRQDAALTLYGGLSVLALTMLRFSRRRQGSTSREPFFHRQVGAERGDCLLEVLDECFVGGNDFVLVCNRIGKLSAQGSNGLVLRRNDFILGGEGDA